MAALVPSELAQLSVCAACLGDATGEDGRPMAGLLVTVEPEPPVQVAVRLRLCAACFDQAKALHRRHLARTHQAAVWAPERKGAKD